MNYLEAIEYIHGTYKFGSKPGLERIEKLLSLLNNPQENLKFVHVAGTNGKGSTVSFISSILIEADYRVGIFTSPFIQRFNERIKINTEEISNSDIARLMELMKSKIDTILSEGGEHPTEFEILTAIAIQYFSECRCDIVVFETGLGGVVDSTNIINDHESLVSVITAIGFDHMEYLGYTISEITEKKAGIIKKNQDVVLYPQNSEITDIIKERCDIQGSKLHAIDAGGINVKESGLEGQTFDFENYYGLKINLLGRHQIMNAAVAVKAVEMLIEKGYSVTEGNIREGLLTAKWPGRFEILSENPIFMVDGAHNDQGTSILAENLRVIFPNKKIIFIVGVLADKEYEKMLSPMLEISKTFITITPNSTRAMTAEMLADYLKGLGSEAQPAANINEAMRLALGMASDDDVVCAFGSLYYIGQVISFFQREEKNKIRKHFLKLRGELPEDEHTRMSRSIYEKIIVSQPFKEAKTLFTFFSTGSEPDTHMLIKEAWRLGKTVAIPRVTGRGTMDFIPISSFDGLVKSKFGIPEPASGQGIQPDRDTLVIVPGLAFDSKNYRIGYGGGFYDRFLQDKILLAAVGICFSFQRIEKINTDEFDIPVDFLITEKN